MDRPANVPPAPYSSTLSGIATAYPLLGIALCHHRNYRGQPLRFSTMPYLVELYRDFPAIEGADAVKAVQTGWTELVVQLAIERAGFAGRSVAYVLPKGRLRDNFVQTRIDPPLRRVPAYRALVPGNTAGSPAPGDGGWADGDDEGPGNLQIKRLGPGVMRFLGSNVADEFVEFSTDVLIVDEYDHCDQDNIELARDRLRASPYPQMFRLGNPTSPGRGIARLYDEGDGRRFFWRCDRCGERQPLDWEVNVVERDARGRWVARDAERRGDDGPGPRPVCRRCARPFDRAAGGAGWVAARPPAGRRSYTMSRLDVLDQSLRALVAEWRRVADSPHGAITFRRSVLGEACDAVGYRLAQAMVDAASTGPAMDEQGGPAYDALSVVAGVDVGAVLNVIVDVVERDAAGEPVRRMVLATTVGSFGAAYDVLLRYRVQVAVFDAGPEMHAAQNARDRARREGGRLSIWLCRFHKQERVGAEKYGMKLDHVSRVVHADRTQLLDATFDDVTEGRRRFPRDVARVDEFHKQMGTPVRQLSERGDRYEWSKTSAADHYRLADAYARVAMDVRDRGGSYMVIDRGGDDGWPGDDGEGGDEE